MNTGDTVNSLTVGLEGRVCVGDDSPWFNGHFPDDPIFPGIAQIQLVLDLIADELQEPLQLIRLSRVKFKKIVRPGEILDIHAAPGNKENLFTFTIQSGNKDVCSGMISLEPSTITPRSS